MAKEKTFVNGMIVKDKHENTPDWVIANVSFKVEDMKAFLDQHQDNGWVNVQIKKGQGGKRYAELDTWKPHHQTETPEQQQAKQEPPAPAPVPPSFPADPAEEGIDDIPF